MALSSNTMAAPASSGCSTKAEPYSCARSATGPRSTSQQIISSNQASKPPTMPYQRPVYKNGRRTQALVPPTSLTTRISSTRRSEEHTSELQSRENLVCRLLLEKKKKSDE